MNTKGYIDLVLWSSYSHNYIQLEIMSFDRTTFLARLRQQGYTRRIKEFTLLLKRCTLPPPITCLKQTEKNYSPKSVLA